MVLRHVSILKDHPQGICLYLAKVTELFKRFEEFFKFKTLNLSRLQLTVSADFIEPTSRICFQYL